MYWTHWSGLADVYYGENLRLTFGESHTSKFSVRLLSSKIKSGPLGPHFAGCGARQLRCCENECRRSLVRARVACFRDDIVTTVGRGPTHPGSHPATAMLPDSCAGCRTQATEARAWQVALAALVTALLGAAGCWWLSQGRVPLVLMAVGLDRAAAHSASGASHTYISRCLTYTWSGLLHTSQPMCFRPPRGGRPLHRHQLRR